MNISIDVCWKIKYSRCFSLHAVFQKDLPCSNPFNIFKILHEFEFRFWPKVYKIIHIDLLKRILQIWGKITKILQYLWARKLPGFLGSRRGWFVLIDFTLKLPLFSHWVSCGLFGDRVDNVAKYSDLVNLLESSMNLISLHTFFVKRKIQNPW